MPEWATPITLEEIDQDCGSCSNCKDKLKSENKGKDGILVHSATICISCFDRLQAVQPD